MVFRADSGVDGNPGHHDEIDDKRSYKRTHRFPRIWTVALQAGKDECSSTHEFCRNDNSINNVQRTHANP